MARIALIVYRILSALIVLPLSFFLRKHPNFQGTIAQRLALNLPQVPVGRDVLWIHAASVGEVKAITGLVWSIREKRPDLFICMSCMTATGRKVASDTKEADCVFPLPFDVAWIMRRHLLRLMPKAVLIVETEIWPNMLLEAERLAVPVVFVNGRMSKRAHGRYLRFMPLFRRILSSVKVFSMAGDDAERFRSIGAQDVTVLGNLKLDHVASGDKTKADALREELGIGHRPVFIAGSVREGEETQVVDAIIRIASKVPDLYSIIAPRHPDRIGIIKDMAQGLNIKWTLRSSGSKGADLLIVDTMGELFTLYGLSDAAFTGGSLVDLGGQNILEPIAWGVPTLHGPFMSNFTWALEAVKGHTVMVKDSRELARAASDMLLDRDASRARGIKAREVLLSSGGVTERYLDAIKTYL